MVTKAARGFPICSVNRHPNMTQMVGQIPVPINNQERIGPADLGARHEPERKEGVRVVMKKIPKFSSEAEERSFWRSADSTEYVDWKKAQRRVFTNLKPSLKTISLRLPESMIEE